MKTIRQIADELGVSKQAVAKRLAQLSPTEVTTNERGAKLISADGEAVLRELIAPIKPPTKPPTDNQLPPTSDNQIIKLLEQNIVVLQEQLAVKDKQLEAAQEALRAEQLLHADTKQMRMLPPAESPEEQPKDKPTFLSRWRSFWSGGR